MDGLTLLVAIVATAMARNVDNKTTDDESTSIEMNHHQSTLISSFGEGYLSGGANLKPRHVSASVHSFRRENQTDDIIINTSRHKTVETTHQEEETNIYPDYYWDTLGHHIAVIELENPINFADTAESMSLSAAGEKPRYGEMLTTGWGITSYASTISPEVLQALRIPAADIAHYSSLHNYELTDRMFFAGGCVNQGVNKDDSESPFYTQKEKLPEMKTSGHNHTATEYPAVPADLTHYFIQEFIK